MYSCCKNFKPLRSLQIKILSPKWFFHTNSSFISRVDDINNLVCKLPVCFLIYFLIHGYMSTKPFEHIWTILYILFWDLPRSFKYPLVVMQSIMWKNRQKIHFHGWHSVWNFFVFPEHWTVMDTWQGLWQCLRTVGNWLSQDEKELGH